MPQLEQSVCEVERAKSEETGARYRPQNLLWNLKLLFEQRQKRKETGAQREDEHVRDAKSDVGCPLAIGSPAECGYHSAKTGYRRGDARDSEQSHDGVFVHSLNRIPSREGVLKGTDEIPSRRVQ